MDLNIIREFLAQAKAKEAAGSQRLRELLASAMSGAKSGARDAMEQFPTDIRDQTVDVVAPFIKPWVMYAKSRGVARDDSAGEAHDKGGILASAPIAIRNALRSAMEPAGEFLFGHGPSSTQTPLTAAPSAPTTTAAEITARKKKSVNDVVSEFLKSGGKGVIRVTGDEFSYSAQKPNKTASFVPYNAARPSGGLTKEAAQVAAAQAKGASAVRAAVLSQLLAQAPDPKSLAELTKASPTLRAALGISDPDPEP